MSRRDTARLRELEALAPRFGGGEAARKRELLAAFEKTRLARTDHVRRLHEALCFLRALPDDADLLALVERMLEAFPRRADLRAHREALADTGIAGTDVRFDFYAPTARWLAAGWPTHLTVDWEEVRDAEKLKDRVYLLGLEAETVALDHAKLGAREWVERFRGPDETDATFLVRRIAALPWDPTLRDLLWDELALPLVFRTGPDTPSRTTARLRGGRTVFQTGPWRRPRPDLREEARRAPLSIRAVSRRVGQEVVDLARGAMMTRARDLDAFAGGDPNDVRVIDCGGGLELALVGVQPDWRMILESVYGWLILRNRIPIGYVLTSAFLRSSELAFNVFDTWRGGDAAHVYGRVIAATRAVFGSDTFTIYPYQLGHGNPEGLESGAWWFYQKLGFRPRDAGTVALMERELARMRRDPGHRSSVATLEELARANVYLELGRRRASVVGTFPFERVGLAITDALSARFGSDRDRAERVCADEAAELLGVRAWRRFPRHERAAWLRWGPLLAVLPGLARWSASDKHALVEVVRAKGGRRESDYVRLFDAHRKLTAALLRLAGARR